jgi:hypothetical protein
MLLNIRFQNNETGDSCCCRRHHPCIAGIRLCWIIFFQFSESSATSIRTYTYVHKLRYDRVVEAILSEVGGSYVYITPNINIASRGQRHLCCSTLGGHNGNLVDHYFLLRMHCSRIVTSKKVVVSLTTAANQLGLRLGAEHRLENLGALFR